MNLCFSYRTIGQFHSGVTLSFPPAAFAIELAKARKRPNRGSGRERFHFGYRTADLEEHGWNSSRPDLPGQRLKPVCFHSRKTGDILKTGGRRNVPPSGAKTKKLKPAAAHQIAVNLRQRRQKNANPNNSRIPHW